MIEFDRLPPLGLPPDVTPDARAVPPAWVRDWLASSSAVESAGDVKIVEGGGFRLVTIRVPGASSLGGPALESAAAEAYSTLAARLTAPIPWHPLRIWNFVPRILGDGGDGMDRYMRFNAGRFRAFSDWLGGAEGFDRTLPAASAVGHGGSDLLVHALAASVPGVAVHNPRQISPHHYSKRFGPIPPCFARATRVATSDGRQRLLVGGTASIRGEDSMFVGDLGKQIDETLANLAAVVTSAFGNVDRPLDAYRSLRVYVVREGDIPQIRAGLAASMPRLDRVEWMPAELCRGDLLVEIEGLAEAP